jgi:flagellar basal-body rod protein FlgB
MKLLFDGVDRLGATMTFHRERHQVLASNLANVETPGYRPLDLTQGDPLEAAGGAMARTHAGHLGPAEGAPGTTSTFVEGGEQPGKDGNAVSLERELAKLNANRVRFTTASELVSRRLALIRYAAGDGSGA